MSYGEFYFQDVTIRANSGEGQEAKEFSTALRGEHGEETRTSQCSGPLSGAGKAAPLSAEAESDVEFNYQGVRFTRWVCCIQKTLMKYDIRIRAMEECCWCRDANRDSST
jgi:hypothetical protein